MPRFCGGLPAKQRSIRPALNCATSPINSTGRPQAFGAPRLPADRALAIERVAQAGADQFCDQISSGIRSVLGSTDQDAGGHFLVLMGRLDQLLPQPSDRLCLGHFPKTGCLLVIMSRPCMGSVRGEFENPHSPDVARHCRSPLRGTSPKSSNAVSTCRFLRPAVAAGHRSAGCAEQQPSREAPGGQPGFTRVSRSRLRTPMLGR